MRPTDAAAIPLTEMTTFSRGPALSIAGRFDAAREGRPWMPIDPLLRDCMESPSIRPPRYHGRDAMSRLATVLIVACLIADMATPLCPGSFPSGSRGVHPRRRAPGHSAPDRHRAVAAPESAVGS